MHHDTRLFRQLFSRFTTGIAVVLHDEQPTPTGMTVNSLTSVSLDPMLLLFCARNESKSANRVLRTGCFSVNILSQEQRKVSEYFAGKSNISNVYYRRHRGFAWIENALAVFLCEVKNCYPGGDHRIIVGQVIEMFDMESNCLPLVFFDGKYHSLRDRFET